MNNHIIILAEPEGYSPKAVATFKKLGSIYEWETARNRPSILRKADVLAVKLGMRISKRMMDRLPNLKVIATSTTGLNHIDIEEAKSRGIAIVSLRGETRFLRTITPTAEEAIGLMIALMRKLPWAFESLKRGEWRREKYYGREMSGRILGIVGLGRLGRIVARYARVFGMQVIACDPYVSASAMRRQRVQKASMDSVFKQSDIISLHVLLTPKTHHLIKRRHLRLMKPGAYFINTARGELVDEKALLEALEKHWIAGAALDVLADEDPEGSHIKTRPLVAYARKHENLLIMPHLGGASFDAMTKTENFIAGKITEAVRPRVSKREGQRRI